jgi:hypothetical protein
MGVIGWIVGFTPLNNAMQVPVSRTYKILYKILFSSLYEKHNRQMTRVGYSTLTGI